VYKDLLQKRGQVLWWDDQPVAQEDIQYFKDCINLSPSKQNNQPYVAVFFPGNEKFKKWLVTDATYCGSKDENSLSEDDYMVLPNLQPEKRMLNRQYIAPLCVYVLTNYKDQDGLSKIEIGMAGMNLINASIDRGYDAALGRCLGEAHDTVRNKLGFDSSYKIELMIGIGKGICSYEHFWREKKLHNRPLFERRKDINKRYMYNNDGSIVGLERHNVPVERQDTPHRLKRKNICIDFE